MKKKIIYLMLGLLALLLLLPYLVVSQDFTINAGEHINIQPRVKMVSPNPETFCDTLLVSASFVTDTTTGALKTKNVFQERKGNVSMFWNGYDWREYKEAYYFRYWYFYDGSQVFIEPERILQTFPAK
jgi:hypothetical protein